MDPITFFLAGHPHPQPRPAIVRKTGRVYYPDKAGKLKRWVGCIRRDTPTVARFGNVPLRISLTLHITRPANHWTRRGQLSSAGRCRTVPPFDLDNYAKCILDTMQGEGVFTDDRNIVELNVRKRWCVRQDTPPGCMVTLAPALLAV
jgi:Holliday junction resolvase RusA-like endonuclease